MRQPFEAGVRQMCKVFSPSIAVLGVCSERYLKEVLDLRQGDHALDILTVLCPRYSLHRRVSRNFAVMIAAITHAGDETR